MRPAIVIVTALTILRLALAAAYPFLDTALRLPAVAVGAASDLLDGRIARRFHAETWAGGLLDAVSDKLFTLSILGVAWHDSVLNPWLLAAVLARDFAVAAAAAAVAVHRRWDGFRRMPSRPLGKATTAAVFALGILVVAAPGLVTLVDGTAAVAGGLSVLAAGDYLRELIKARRGLRPLRGPLGND
ncbi:MAG: CDP-alcohol phosphatidyltransferase family protein [Ardenticatenales bacterium]|nr:CDP-alcohol phosphatidyltransferase family protein [Ardenticatenales bacterium]